MSFWAGSIRTESAPPFLNPLYNCTFKNIDNCAFFGCTSLTSITIPNSVTYIGNFAFDGCTSLTEVSLNVTQNPKIVDELGDDFNCETAEDKCTKQESVL